MRNEDPAAPRSTRGCGVEPAFAELGVAIGRGVEEAAGELGAAAQVDDDVGRW
ncbi:hypothetical protein [Sorangium sp. So ce1151]|uniref:hypothetical protein n=1 Tax=Sorangium sp. So ce1151 TaxID=3133332 RepID=UPI003F5DF17A